MRLRAVGDHGVRRTFARWPSPLSHASRNLAYRALSVYGQRLCCDAPQAGVLTEWYSGEDPALISRNGIRHRSKFTEAQIAFILRKGEEGHLLLAAIATSA
jgi:hypothetical protein